MNLCNCQSGSLFEDCCAPFLKGKKAVSCPEEVLRSRYSAYALGDVRYIRETAEGPALANLDDFQVRDWMNRVVLLGLTILTVEEGTPEVGTDAKISFLVKFREDGKENTFFETSIFKQVSGRWVYWDCEVLREVGRLESDDFVT